MCGVCRDAFVRVSLFRETLRFVDPFDGNDRVGSTLDPTDLFRTCLHGAWYSAIEIIVETEAYLVDGA